MSWLERLNVKRFKSGNNTPTQNDLEFEQSLDEYIRVIRRIRAKMVKKYAEKANQWFGIK